MSKKKYSKGFKLIVLQEQKEELMSKQRSGLRISALIEKYAAVLDIENLSEPPNYLEENNKFEESKDAVETTKIA